MKWIVSFRRILSGALLAAISVYLMLMVYVHKGQVKGVLSQVNNSHLKVIHNVPQSYRATRICSQQERIAHLKRFCREIDLQLAKRPWKGPAKGPSKRRRKAPRAPYLAGRSLVDHKHQLAYCGISKAGSTMLKSLILQANGLNLTSVTKSDDPLYFVHMMPSINKYGVQLMYQVKGSRKKLVIENYFHTISIRHPFDRMASYYRDKILQDDRSGKHHFRVKDILRELRPQLFINNKTLAAVKWPQDVLGPPTFNEFITYIVRHRHMDEHWFPIDRVCYPCLLDWEAILRVETMSNDGRIFLNALNRNQLELPVRHSHASSQPTMYFSKRLSEYGTLLDRSMIEYFLKMYTEEMGMFGYGWHNETNTAYCYIDTEDGGCC